MFYLMDKTENLSPRDAASQIARRDCSKEGREEPGYLGVFATKTRQSDIKRLLFIKENQIAQVKEFSTFLCMWRCKSLGSLKSFLWHAPQFSGACVLLFSILSPLRVHSWRDCSGWGLGNRQPVCLHCLSPSWVPSGLVVVAWRLQHPLFTDMAGNIFFTHTMN